MTEPDAFLFILAAVIIWIGTAALMLKAFDAAARHHRRRRAVGRNFEDQHADIPADR